MTDRSRRVGMAALVFAAVALWLAPAALSPAPVHAGGGKEAKAKKAAAEDAIVQHSVLRWRDGWAYDAPEASSTHAEGELAAGEVTLERRADGIRLQVRDADVVKHNAYSIWFQICPPESVFIDNDTQCSLPKLINMNGGGDVAGPHGINVTFDLAVGTAVGPRNVCDFDPAYLTTPCPAWSVPGILAGEMVFTSEMALHAPVRIVVKDHGPKQHVKDLGKTLGMKTQEALFTAMHRTDGPECQPARPVCPDAHVAVFAAPDAE